jgi:hypothetical protein
MAPTRPISGRQTHHRHYRWCLGDPHTLYLAPERIHFIKQAYGFLVEIASILALNSGKGILAQWIKSMMEYGSNYERDKSTYSRIKLLGVCERSRTQELPEMTSAIYLAD